MVFSFNSRKDGCQSVIFSFSALLAELLP